MTFTLLYSFSSVRQAYRWAHGAAAVLHIASVAALIGFSVRDSTASARYAIALNINYKAWLPGSPNATDCDTYQCVPTDTTASYQEVNLLHACAVFGAWSGIFHIAAVIKLWGTGNNDELNKNVLRAIRAMDYGVSAPVMLLVKLPSIVLLHKPFCGCLFSDAIGVVEGGVRHFRRQRLYRGGRERGTDVGGHLA